MEVRAGFDGYYKAEYWVPIHVTVANNGPDIEGELRIATNTNSPADSIVYNTPISLPTQSNKRVTLYIKVPNFHVPNVQLLDGRGNVVGERSVGSWDAMPLEGLLYGVVSPAPGELDFLEDVTGGRSEAAVSFLDISELPETAPAWSALDVLIFNDVDTGQLTTDQLQALQSWVSTGGQLMVTGGPGWQKTAAALGDMLPVTLTGSESVNDLPALSEDVGIPFRDPGPYLVTSSSLSSGELVFHQDGLPLLARQPWGRGAVYYLALDPTLAPLLDWDGSEVLFATIAEAIPTLPYWAREAPKGYEAATAVSSLPTLAFPSATPLILFLLVYIIITGPINYFVLKRLGRRELAWITIPALVIIFSAAAYVTGFQIRGNDIIINQMSIVHGKIGSEQGRVHTLIGLYSPRRSSYDLVLSGNTLARPFERIYGNVGGSGRIDAVTHGSDLTIHNIRVDVAGIETFTAESYRPLPAVSGQINLYTENNTLQLSIDIQNNSDLVLENASLQIGSNLLAIGDIGPGESSSSSQNITPSTPSGGSFRYGPGPGGGALLSRNAEIILGTSDYYSDKQAFPRWQLIQALDNPYYGSSQSTTIPKETVTLIAWTGEQQLDVALGEQQTYNTLGTTLYFLELPLVRNLAANQQVMVPVALLNWEILGQNHPYQPSIHNMYLNQGWVEFEYKPWQEFQTLAVSQLAISLETVGSPSEPTPDVRLWNWQENNWDPIENINWGQTAVSQPERYLSPDNAIRIHIETTSPSGINIQEIAPLLTGTLE